MALNAQPTGKTPQDIEAKPKEPDGTSSPRELKNALYARCASQPEGKVFGQDELLSFNIIPDNDVQKLLAFTRQLTKDGLFRLMTKEGKVCWRVVKKDDAAKYKTLTPDEALVYSYIESAGREGIWSKLLRMRTNLHMTTMNRALKALENRNYIKSIKTVKFPTRKTYILAKLQPSEDVTGGAFYTDGVLDAEFIQQMSWWAERYVIGRSWWHPPVQHGVKRKHNSSRPTQEQAEDMRAEEFQKRSAAGRERSKHMLPLPASYKGFPTIAEITNAINASELSGVTMRTSEMQQLVDILCWDGRLEKVNDGQAYRAMRTVAHEANGLMEAPCGRCPVFEFCEENGPVNARSCEYFQDWLEF